jgi:hypothetical protein
MERLGRDKHSSLLGSLLGGKKMKCCNYDPRSVFGMLGISCSCFHLKHEKQNKLTRSSKLGLHPKTLNNYFRDDVPYHNSDHTISSVLVRAKAPDTRIVKLFFVLVCFNV